MKIQEQRHGAVTVLKPDGPLVEADAEAFKQAMSATLAASMGRFVVDLSAVPFTDSRGLEVLVEINEQMSDGGQALKLCSPGKTVREALELTDLAELFDHFDDVNSAVRSFL
jgi:anti-sigma B factor antagonist